MPAIPGRTQSAQQEEDDSADDDDFLANVEELPDTDELDEDELPAEDSDEPPYELETDVLHLRGDRGSIASGTPAEAPWPGEGGCNKRRRLSAGTPVSDTTAPPSSSWDRRLPAAAQSALPTAATTAQAQIHEAAQKQRSSRLPQQHLDLTQQVQLQSNGLSSVLSQHAQLPPLQQQYPQREQAGKPAKNPRGSPMQPMHNHTEQQPGQLAGHQQQQHAAPGHEHKQPVPVPQQQLHPPSQLAHQQYQPQTQSQQRSPTATSATAATPSLSALESANASQHDDADDEAICLRTRSKHPLASEEFDPDMFDRLLAEFDPDVEPLIDDAMYQQFLQSLQTDGPTGNQFPLDNTLLSNLPAATGPTAGLDPTAIASLAGTGAALSSVSAAPVATGSLTGFPVAVPAGAAAEDDEDDEEFQLDPLDWLLDDERDAEEEERLARLVQVQAQMAGHQEGPAAGDRRRSQRGAARIAAERIAQKQQQQQQMMLLQRQQHLLQQAGPGSGMLENNAYVQPLIPAPAAGWPLSAAAIDHPGAVMPLPHAQPQQLSLQESPLQPSMAVMQPLHINLQQQQEQYLNPASEAVGSMPQLLTLTDNQLKQLYQQLSLHTQLLTQLYVLTARDPSTTAQVLASSAGQMLGDIKRLHAAAEGSYRGGQLAELLQQALLPGGSSTDDWTPSITDMTTVWDTVPLRLLDDVVPQLRVTPMLRQPLLERLQQQELGSPRHSGNSSKVAQAAAKEAKKMIDTVLDPICKNSGGYDASAWPVLAPRGKAGIWTTAEDDLLWLGIIRFHNAVRPLPDTAQVISQELVPSKSASSILTRFKNIIRRKVPTAEMVLKYAFVGKERPTGWESKDPTENQDDQNLPVASAGYGPRTNRGPMWAAGELGAALTAAFAAAELGLPSAAAAAAAGVLLHDGTVASAGGGSFENQVETQANQAVNSGEQLLQEFTAATSVRWPFHLAAPLEVPSAKSIRRAPQSLNRTVDQAAGEHLLLSLAARQILQGDPEAAAAEAATLAGNNTVGAGPAVAGVPSSNGLLAGLFPSGPCSTQQQILSATDAVGAQKQGGEGASMIGSLTALLQGSPAPRDGTARSSPAAAETFSSQGQAASALAADTCVFDEGAMAGDNSLPSPGQTHHQQQGHCGTAGNASGTAVQQSLHHKVQQQRQHPALQQGSIRMIGGTLAGIFGLSNPANFAGRKRRQPSCEAPLAAAPGADSCIQQGASGSHQDGQQQRKQTRRSGSPTTATAAGATAAITVDTDDEDMDFGDPASTSTSVQKQQQDNQHHHQHPVHAHEPLPVCVTQQHANQHRSSPGAATNTISAGNAAGSTVQTGAGAGVGGGVSGKQLRRSLFGSQKAAAVVSAQGRGAQHTTMSRSKAASPPSAASPAPAPPATATQGAIAADDVRGSSQHSMQQKNQQRQPRPLAPRASAAWDARPVGSSSSGAACLGQSVFSAAAAAAYTDVTACVGFGSGAKPLQAAPQTSSRVTAATEGRSGASVPTGTSLSNKLMHGNIIGLSGLLSNTKSSTGGPKIRSKGRQLAHQQLTGATALPPQPAVALGDLSAAVLVPPPAAGIPVVRESVTARAARRLAEAEAQDAALLAAAAVALPIAQLPSSTVNQQLQLGSTGAQAVFKRPKGRGGWRRHSSAPLNGCVLSSATALRLGSSTPASASSVPALPGLSSMPAFKTAGRRAAGVGHAAATCGKVTQLSVSSVAAVDAAGEADAQQAGSMIVQDKLLASLQSVLQLPTAVIDSNGTLHKQQQVQDEQQVSGPGLPSVADLQSLVLSLSQSLASKHSNHHRDIDMQAVYAVLAAQQRQEAAKQQCKLESQQSRLVEKEPVVCKQQQQLPHQETVSPSSKAGSRTPGSARKQKRQRLHVSDHVSNYSAPPKFRPQQKSQAAAASISYGVLDCSALQALAEAAAKAMRGKR